MIIPEITDYLVQNQSSFKETFKPILEKKNDLCSTEHQIFHDEIELQCWETIKWCIANDICNSLALDFETVYSELEDINLKEYLK